MLIENWGKELAKGWVKEPCHEHEFCKAKVFYIDGRPFTATASGGSITPHECRVTNTSLPDEVFMGVWYNRRNNRTRHTGPFKTEKGARRLPENHYGSRNLWELLFVYKASPKWEELPKDDTVYVSDGYGRTQEIPINQHGSND